MNSTRQSIRERFQLPSHLAHFTMQQSFQKSIHCSVFAVEEARVKVRAPNVRLQACTGSF